MNKISLIALAILVGGAGTLLVQKSRVRNLPTNARANAELGQRMQKAVLTDQDMGEIEQILRAGFKIDDPIGCGTFNCVDGAVAVGNVKMLKFFLANGAQAKSSALMQAAWCKDSKVSFQLVQALLNAGAEAGYREYFPTNYVTGDTHEPDSRRFTSPLHVACYQSYSDVTELLLSRPGVEINALDIDGRTPLMWAADKGNKKIVAMLLAKGADMNLTNGRGQTAASFAHGPDQSDILEILQKASMNTKLSAAN